MTSCLLGSRARRVAALRLLFVCAVLEQAGNSIAQEMVGGNPSGENGIVVSDDGSAGIPSDLGYGACGYPGTCEGTSCNDCGVCQPGCDERCCSFWVGAEWLRWHLDGKRLPPLVTEGPAATPLANVARLDDPDTLILSGREHVNDDWRDGYRLSAGVWFDCCHSWGIGGDYFNTGDDDYNFTSVPNPNVIVGRPFFNTQTGLDDAAFISVPDQLDGAVHVNSSDEFQGAGVTLNHCIWRYCDPCCEGHGAQLTMLGGYRFYKYDSNLTITENLTVMPNNIIIAELPATTFFIQDRFRTENEFNGGEIGLQGVGKHCWWWLDCMAKVAMGEQQRTVIVDGQTITTVPNQAPTSTAGGLLTSAGTIGRYHDSDFAFIPEFRVGGGVMVTHCCSLRAGYDVIIWSDVARAASELPPGLAVPPTFPGMRGSELVAQGFDFSVTCQF